MKFEFILKNKSFLCILFLLFTAILPQFPIIFSHYTYYPTEYFKVAYPWSPQLMQPNDDPIRIYSNFFEMESLRVDWQNLYLIQSFLHTGELPLWNPYIFSGVPFLASALPSVFKPTNLFLLFFPINQSSAFASMVSLFVAAVSTFLLLRRYSLSPFSALLGSVAFEYNTFFLININKDIHIYTFTFLPVVILLLDKIYVNGSFEDCPKRERLHLPIILGLVFALQILGGFLEFVVYCTLVYFAYIILMSYNLKKLNIPIKKIFALNIKVIFCLFLGVMIALPQVLPVFELLKYSNRIPLTQSMQVISIPPWFLLTMVFPFIFGGASYSNFISFNLFGYWGMTFDSILYLCPLVFLLVIIAIVFNDSKECIFFKILSLFSILWASSGPLYSFFISHIPFFNSIQTPARIIPIFFFCTAVLAGFGTEEIIKGHIGLTNNSRREAFFKNLLILFVCIFSLSAIILFYNHFFLSGLLRTIPHWIPYYSFYNFKILGPIILALISISMIYIYIKKNKSMDIHFVVLSLLIFNSMFFLYEARPLGLEQDLFQETPGIEFLQQHSDYSRITALTNESKYNFYSPGFSDILEANFNIPYNLYDVRGHGSLYPKRVHDYGAYITGLNPDSRWQRLNIDIQKFNLKLLSIANVKYIITAPTEEIEKTNCLKNVYTGQDMKIYENICVLQKAYMVYNWTVINDRSEQFSYLTGSEFDPTKTVVLEEEPTFSSPIKNHNPIYNVSIIHCSPNKIILYTDSTSPGLLVISDGYDPNWNAYVDNRTQKTKIYIANHAFRAIPIPQGEHFIECLYEPSSFYYGIIFACFGFLLLMIFGVYVFMKNMK